MSRSATIRDVMAHIALLRGINVGGHVKASMPDVRNTFEALGLHNPRTFLNTGNVVFDSDLAAPGELEELLEEELRLRLQLQTDVLVRSAEEWASVLAGNPFPLEAERDPGHLLVMFLKLAPSAQAVEALRAASSGPEAIEARGRRLYLTYPEGIGRSKLTNALIEARLGTRGTGRNWNTVLRLYALTQRTP